MTTSQTRPVIDRVFHFDEMHEAFRYFEEGRPFGRSSSRKLKGSGFRPLFAGFMPRIEPRWIDEPANETSNAISLALRPPQNLYS
jgi:hypothetical protein